ncbi:MAG: hypothetical protein UT39_C0011G0008 [Candidatus Woesebacteria bacterium GW2011_GWA1_39_21]|uniref:Uncharacterized protein n=1 Tax=Candidatus Woesebacteria bacterium GW2011_GWA1_39_21 TaxID=1618550 RepID=A0A0G0NEC2_9BACT|nr:MAG: hypothetical protein UT39_C0011G0008 [Candidatus Woesebacteria bacterium GW2011_GWA1_39_21]
MGERILTIFSILDRQVGDTLTLAARDGSGETIYGVVVGDLSEDSKYIGNVHNVRGEGNVREENLGANYYRVQIGK